jgi:outer membrane lipoprotein-sorting protein
MLLPRISPNRAKAGGGPHGLVVYEVVLQAVPNPMNSATPPIPAPSDSVPPGSRFSSFLLALSLLIMLPLTGCIRTHVVDKTVVPSRLMNATLEQLVKQMNDRFGAVQTLNATVDITATTGGHHEGQVKEIPTSAGYIFLRKPLDLRVLMLVPVLRSRAVDMVSDGKSFKLLMTVPATPARAIEGSEQVTKPSKNGLENLRPSVIRDALLVPAVQPDEYMDLTESSRLTVPVYGKKARIEEPDYDVVFLLNRSDHVLERVRVIHISRVTLLPYQQDIYDHSGHVVTVVAYDRYQKFGDIDYPTSILITRPLDEYTLKIDISKLVINGKLDDEQFQLKFPEGLTIRNMP